MSAQERQYPSGKVAPGDLTQSVGVEVIAARGVNVEELVEKLIDAAGPNSRPIITTPSCA